MYPEIKNEVSTVRAQTDRNTHARIQNTFTGSNNENCYLASCN